MWYVIWTTTGMEESVKQEIEKYLPQTLYTRCFVPYREEQRRISGVWQKVKKVLFPGYLFVESEDIEGLYMELKQTPFLTILLKTDDCLTSIRQDEERLLRRLMGDDDTVDISTGIIENDEVIITSGPLEGLEGYITKVDRHKRKAYLNINLFDRTTDVCVGLEIVEKR